MQLYELEPEEPRRKKRNVSGNTKRKPKSKQKELQMIGAAPRKRQERHQKIRADVVTNLDIIGEEEFEVDREQRLVEQQERKRRERQRRHIEEQEQLRREARRNQRRIDEYEDAYEDEDYDDYCDYDDYDRRKRSSRHTKKKRKRAVRTKLFLIISILIMLGAIAFLIREIWNLEQTQEAVTSIEGLFAPQKKVAKPDMVEDLLDINEYSRPGEALGKVKNIFVHYTANPGTTAKQNRDYFEGLAESGETSASAHFVIGYDGEIIQCIPLEEIGYAVAEHNNDSISIECCYVEEDGRFTDATYESLLHLTTWLMGQYKLSADDILRHHDASGKLCPKYFVEHPEAWTTFKVDLENYIEKNGTTS
ncbi:MAG: peptidoglycan recognition family protein [Lachnospiraceae bacterium]|nr:peptidoglycan recognition family protein [Lachnospiraceae bacterium]